MGIWRMRTTVGVVALSAVAMAFGATAVPAGATGRTVCATVRLTGTGQDRGFDSSGNDHTTATVSALGVAIGSTNATFTFSGAPVGTNLAFTGPIVFTPRIGQASLTAHVTGGVNADTGDFTATSSAITGTGSLAAISGHLSFRGQEDLATGAFTETINGILCAPVTFDRTARS